MGKITRFDPRRRKPRWTSARDYRNRRKKPPQPARFGKNQSGWAGAVKDVRGWLLLIALATVFAIVLVWSSSRQPQVVSVSPGVETVTAHFSRCSLGRTSACVTDGDTIRLGQRRIRLVGFDTAEKKARCDYERTLAERSTVVLQEWLNRGQFEMRIEGHDSVDRYDRDLRTITRRLPDGTLERLSDYMIANGGARRYFGGRRAGWC